MGYTPERTCPLSCHQLCCCGILANTVRQPPVRGLKISLQFQSSAAGYTQPDLTHYFYRVNAAVDPNYSAYNFTYIVLFLLCTRKEPGSNPALGMVILTDVFLVSCEFHEKNATTILEVRPRFFSYNIPFKFLFTIHINWPYTYS